MSVDIFVTKPRRLPLARTFGENLATNVAFDTLCLNISIAADGRSFEALDLFLDSQPVPARLVPILSREWKDISDLFTARSPSQLVRYGSAREPMEGTVLQTLDNGTTILRPSPTWIAEEIRLTEEDARHHKKTGFAVKTLRDVFWYQFDVVDRILTRALRLKRGIHLG